ncbi:hypothetical protein SDC9_106234 [bioreactor metagenome]|uniref:Uncharacterized protein n=1 Tax=bioreactor metagenome TaxID=1076179 RepID=A0A645B1R7_9ZZZZ
MVLIHDSLAAHQQVGDKGGVIVSEDQQVLAKQALHIFHADSQKGAGEGFERVLCLIQGHLRRGDGHLPPQQHVHSCGGGAHGDVPDFAQSVNLLRGKVLTDVLSQRLLGIEIIHRSHLSRRGPIGRLLNIRYKGVPLRPAQQAVNFLLR